MRLLGFADDEALRAAVEGAARALEAELTLLSPAEAGSSVRDDRFYDALRTHPDAAIVQFRRALLDRARDESQTRGIALVAACRN
ncbi:MAG: hypothetical protein KY444_02240, partial [Gemmatimonadetes bacterium]|nr:hypothetical protein [Gemmatimonadota bacterium]